MDIRQFDGDILDWLPDHPGSVLMQRNYVQQVNLPGIGEAIEGAKGLGVDHIDLSNLKMTSVERPSRRAGLSNGRSRQRTNDDVGQDRRRRSAQRRIQVQYRRLGSYKWEEFSEYN